MLVLACDLNQWATADLWVIAPHCNGGAARQGNKTAQHNLGLHYAAVEAELVAHLEHAALYASAAPANGVFRPRIDFPPHERCVELAIDLAVGTAGATVLGADLTHEYISENADYRT